jgi:hypothetical protein
VGICFGVIQERRQKCSARRVTSQYSSSLTISEANLMSYRKHVDQRLLKKEKGYETDQLMKEKRSEEYEVLEVVFDVNERF